MSVPLASGALRIAVVHSFYSSRQPSGENTVVDLQVAALRTAGHSVRLIARHTDDLERARTYPIRAGLRAATGLGDNPLAEIADFGPDVVHLHNLFPNLGRRWVGKVAAPLVSTVHNYRAFCPGATLMRDGHECTLCPDHGTARYALAHSCFKGSRAQTVPVMIGTRFERDPVLAHSDRVVVLNDLMKQTYVRFGVDPDRVVTVPNFVPAQSESAEFESAQPRTGPWLFVGRLTHDKGVVELLRQWPSGQPLEIVGSGPQEAEARSLAGADVRFLGQRSHAEVGRLMRTARGLVFPSLWPEGLPTVYLEALAAGLPVLAWPQSVVGNLVQSQGTGLVKRSDLATDLSAATETFPALSEHCRQVHARTYSEQAWLDAIGTVYRAAMDRH